MRAGKIATVETSLRKALARIEVKRCHRSQHGAHGQHSHQK